MPDEWYFGKDGRQLGPVSVTALREMAANGQLQPTDLVWTSGMSQWAPAASTRGLFPKAAAAAAPAPLPPETPQPEPRRQRFPREREDSDTFRRIRRQDEGWSTGAKLALAGGILAFCLVLVVGAVIGVLVLAEASSQRVQRQPPPPRFAFQPPPPQLPMQPPNFQPNPNGGPADIPLPLPPPGGFPRAEAGKDYNATLTRNTLSDVRMVDLPADAVVRIKVNTTEWGGGFEPDVDLHVYGPDGLQVMQDIGPEKDCLVTFTALDAGTYQVMIVLFSGNRAACKVSIEILNKK
jgi:hypothetical protein